jgi:uncharacterized protein (DUF2236 family)
MPVSPEPMHSDAGPAAPYALAMARLPAPLQRRVEIAARGYFEAPELSTIDFTRPGGAPALCAPDSVTWRVMKNPVALIVGGIAAVILELAEPRVRTGVWEHTSFRRDPVTRIRRTGYAAMVTVYAPADVARTMIAGVVRAHERIEGVTPAGTPYRANDEELLNWVNATAAFGFFEAYRRFVRPLTDADTNALYAEGAAAAALYGARGAPRCAADVEKLFAAMAPKLERSDILFEFFDIMRAAPLLPWRRLQRLMIRAAIEITPPWARERLGLGAELGFRPGYEALVRTMGAAAERLVIEHAPPSQACVRMGLASDHLYR